MKDERWNAKHIKHVGQLTYIYFITRKCITFLMLWKKIYFYPQWLIAYILEDWYIFDISVPRKSMWVDILQWKQASRTQCINSHKIPKNGITGPNILCTSCLLFTCHWLLIKGGLKKLSFYLKQRSGASNQIGLHRFSNLALVELCLEMQESLFRIYGF